jgi:protein-tyrosine phosphatase
MMALTCVVTVMLGRMDRKLSGPATPQAPKQGIFNLRDLGGAQLTGGGTLRPGLLYRSAEPRPGRPEDAGELRRLDVATVIDLRSEPERQAVPSVAELAGARCWHVPLLGDLPGERPDPGSVDPEFISRYYLSIIDRSAAELAMLLRGIADALPALFHCRLGKDRTGVVAALLLGVLGASLNTILADYERSRDAAQAAVRRVPRLAGIHGIRGMLALDGEPMRLFAARLDAERGGFAGLIRELGAEAGVDRLRRVARQPAEGS